MKKFIIVTLIVFVALVALVACKTEDSAASVTPVTKHVTINQNNGTGLTQTVYPVNEGDTLKQADLKGSPAIKYMKIAGYKDDEGIDFALDSTPVKRDMTITVQWAREENIDCKNYPTDTASKINEYAKLEDPLGVACAIAAKIDPDNAYNSNTALYDAASTNHLENVKFLLANGATISKPSVGGRTPIMIAAENGYPELVQFFLENAYPKASVSGADNGGMTPLLKASQNSRLTIVKYLLESGGASIKEANNDGWTALISAAGNNSNPLTGDTAPSDRLGVVKYLATYPGVDLTVRETRYNLTALGNARSVLAGLGSGETTKIQLFTDIINYLVSIKAPE